MLGQTQQAQESLPAFGGGFALAPTDARQVVVEIRGQRHGVFIGSVANV